MLSTINFSESLQALWTIDLWTIEMSLLDRLTGFFRSEAVTRWSRGIERRRRCLVRQRHGGTDA